jgi:hypothetical protein
MRILTAFALGTTLVLCNLGTFSAAAHAKAKVVREARQRVIIRVPVLTPTPWDYYMGLKSIRSPVLPVPHSLVSNVRHGARERRAVRQAKTSSCEPSHVWPDRVMIPMLTINKWCCPRARRQAVRQGPHAVNASAAFQLRTTALGVGERSS